MKLRLSRQPSAARLRGYTLVELVIATSVGLLIAGGGMLLMIETAKEDLRTVADMTAEQAASDLQGRVMRCLRVMSAREAVVYTTPATNGLGFYRIIVARGNTPDYPRAELRFERDTGRAVFNSDRSKPSAEEVFMRSKPKSVVLRNLAFFPSIKQDGTPDNSLINIVLEVDDDGYSRRSTNANPARIQRTFSVKMRNN